MQTKPTPRGIYVPLITPFAPGGEIALDCLEALAASVLDAGAAGIVALGTTAESATLDTAERDAVIGVCARVCADRGAPLIVGAGSNDTRASMAALGELARWPAITGALVPVPPFSRPGAAGVIAHFTQLAGASPVPIVLYHVPARTGQDLDAASLREIGQLPAVTGIKYAASGIDGRAIDLLGDPPPGFTVLAGEDIYLSPMLALGAAGAILASAHLATASYVELTEAWQRGDLPRARGLGHGLARLSTAAFAAPNPTVIKGVLHALGQIPTPAVRLPLVPAHPGLIDHALKTLASSTPA